MQNAMFQDKWNRKDWGNIFPFMTMSFFSWRPLTSKAVLLFSGIELKRKSLSVILESK